MILAVKINLDGILKNKGKSLYALAKETGISYNTVHRIKNNKVAGMSFDVLVKICSNLECTPNDLIKIEK